MGSQFHVNTTTAGNQQSPAVAMAPDGRFLVSWQSDGQDGSSWGVYGQAFQSGGTAAGGEFRVNVTTAGAQHSPAVAFLASAAAPDRFEVIWQSQGQDASGAGAAGVFARAFDGSGNALSGEVAVNVTATGAQGHPRIASDPSGNFVVAWESLAGAGSAVTARRFTATGTPLSGELAVDATAIGSQRNPAVTADVMGNFVVAWESLGQDGSGTAVLAQQFDNREQPQGGKVQLNTTTPGDQGLAAVAASSGEILATWQSVTPSGDGAVVSGRLATLPALRFFTIVPCRMVDTRNANGPLGGPALISGQPRIFPIVSSACGVPSTAKALSLNITVVQPTGGGVVELYPGDAATPPTTSISFAAGNVLANNGVIPLSRGGDGSIAANATVAGPTPNQVHFILDANGYFQ